MPPAPDPFPSPQNRGGGKSRPIPPPCRHEYQTVLGIYFFTSPFSEMKAIMKSKTFTGDMWRLGQSVKRFKKAIRKQLKSWGIERVLNYFQ